MKQNSQPVLTTAQTREQNFLYDLSRALSECDLSKIDLKTLPGRHPAHSALFDNYELNVTRTSVFVHKNNFMKVLGIGDWKFQDGVFERYEIYILENAKNMRARDVVRLSDDDSTRTHNVIMRYGTMATDRGYFAPSKHQLTSNDEEVFYNQNAHLFMPTKQIYNILDAEYNRRQAQIRDYILADIKSETDLHIAQERMLSAIKQNQK
ncbi:MAG: hypothetical protein E7008_02485 [Alphaproteobacteria bacterium]|nr:hypothetical protein [Alphaproteobacteria bacterium]